MGTTVIPSASYPVGEQVFTLPQKAARKYTSFEVSFTRESWPQGVDCPLENGAVQSNVAMQIIFERSNDGSVWRSAGEATFPGGNLIGRNGQPITVSSISFSAKDPSTGQDVEQTGFLRVRVRVLVPLTTAVTIVAVEP